MPSRFEVERAVLASTLPMTRKCIMLVLAAWTDNATAAIRPENRKSLTEIAAAASAGRSTVTRDLDLLEQDGWIARRRPSAEQARQGAKTGYRLLIPEEPRPPRGLGHDVDQGRPPRGLGVTSENDEGRPPRGRGVGHHVAGKAITRPSHSIKEQAPTVPAADCPLTDTQRSKLLTDAYAAAEPICKWPAVNGIVLKVIRSGKFSDEEIEAALLRLAAENRSVTVDTLRVELQGLPASRYNRESGFTQAARIMTEDAAARTAQRRYTPPLQISSEGEQPDDH